MTKKVLTQSILSFCILVTGSCGIDYITDPEIQKFINNNKSINTNVIYGTDDRKDLYAVKNKTHKMYASSVAGLAKRSRVIKKSNGNYQISVNSYGKELQLCKSERFYNQYMTTRCSGALVGDDTILTAGHCITDMQDCNEASFIFDITKNWKEQKINYANFPADNVYFCKDIVYTVYEWLGLDFAVIKLDRKVKNRIPLQYRAIGTTQKGDGLFMIGKPSGLPTKVTDAGKVLSVGSKTFRTDLDAYGSNSGSPVFNNITGDIEGILVSGSLDFIYNKEKGCKESHICNYVQRNSQCRGEEVTRISRIRKYLPKNNDRTIASTSQAVNIPDYQSDGIESALNITNIIDFSKIIIHLDIEHSWSGDLSIQLQSPSGDEISIIKSNGLAGNNIKRSIGHNTDLQKRLKLLTNNSPNGKWRLKIQDDFSRNKGTLKQWAIELKK